MKDFILKNVEVDTDTGCWEWVKSLSGSGYGQITINKTYWSSHRLAYTLFKGDLNKDDIVRHVCHNPKCCNPEHLIKGKSKDNYKDSKERYLRSDKRRRKKWIVKGVKYETCRQAVEKTGISMNSIIKYTNKITREFDYSLYLEGCKKANKS